MKSKMKYLSVTFGLILSVTFVLFMIEFVRNIDFYDFEYTIEALPYLVVSLLCGIIGIPLTLTSIEVVSE